MMRIRIGQMWLIRRRKAAASVTSQKNPKVRVPYMEEKKL